MSKQIVFVYNADSGLFNGLSDMAHKLFSPDTYACNLCAITYHPLGMRKAWKQFLSELDCDYEFLHRDQLVERYDMKDTPLPAVFIKHPNNILDMLIDADAINQCHSMDALAALIRERVRTCTGND